MRLVVDANILVGELLRERGREIISHKQLELFMATKIWEESVHELRKRTTAIAERGQLSPKTAEGLFTTSVNTATTAITVIEQIQYDALESKALRRIPRDPDDWHTVALALALQADIWTQDKDFLGCGVATWTTETLQAKLES